MAQSAQASDQDSQSIIQRLVVEAEIASERLIAWVRIAIAASLLAVYLLAAEAVEFFDLGEMPGFPATSRGAIATVAAFAILGLLALYLSTPARWRHWMAYVFAFADVLLVSLAMYRALRGSEVDGTYIAAIPVAFAIPLVFAIGGLRPRPRVQLFATVALAVGVLTVAILKSAGFDPPSASAPPRLMLFFHFQPNVLRFAMLIASGIIIALAMERSRQMLARSVRESQRRKALTRFLPAEIAPLVTGGHFDSLRRGQRQTATILFADIRDSTGRAEQLDPQRLSVFISSFRRRVMRATEMNGGIVDKFIGDGALVLFGVLDENENGARQAVQCARDLLAYIDRWNEKRQFSPPVQVGIGIHTGEVYVGVVGDERRLEFTVLGDSVNIAARLEQLTKAVGTPLLVSAETITAAGEVTGWELVGDAPLRGRSGELAYFSLEGVSWPVGASGTSSGTGNS